MKGTARKCWICGSDADSGEHRIKKSDIKTLYGSIMENYELLLFRENGTVVPLQSPYNSKAIKSKVLCKNCNSNKTQPYDRAYEKFIEYLSLNKKDILHKRFIDFSMVYGENWGEKQVDLYKYFVKSFGCRLARFNRPIPQDMIDLLDKKTFQTALRITFAVNENIVNLHNDKGIFGGIGNGDIQANQSYIDGDNDVKFYLYSEHYDWLDIYYYYNHNTNGNLGATWIVDNQFIYLGSSNDSALLEAVTMYNLKKIKWFTISQWDSK